VPAGPAVAFRVPARRGVPRLYALPGLEEIETRLTAGPAGERIVGFSADDDLVYILTGTDLTILDLRAGRSRTLDSGVTRATMAPTGQVLLTHADTSLALAAERRVTPVPAPAGMKVEHVWLLPGDRVAVVARADSGRALFVVGNGKTVSRRSLPEGPVTPSAWGDVAAVASPEGVLLVEVLRETPIRRLDVDADVHALAFSASGHRLYVATAEPQILVFERFEGDLLSRIALDGPATALRADPFGRYLFAAIGQRVVTIVLADRTVQPVPGAWRPDLPSAGPDGTILLARDADVISLRPGERDPRGTVSGGARDHWLLAPLDVRRPALQLARADAISGNVGPGGGEIFVQVSSTSNAQWAEGLASDLRTAGMAARVLPPASADEMYRVVLGPYATRDEAEEIGRKLGMPYWIFQRDTTATGTTRP